MKKTFLLICTLAIALVACDNEKKKFETSSDSDSVKLRIAVNNLTKAKAHHGSEAKFDGSYGSYSSDLPTLASFHSQGSTQSSVVYAGADEPAFAFLDYTSTPAEYWYLTDADDNKIPFPLGKDASVNVLTFATDDMGYVADYLDTPVYKKKADWATDTDYTGQSGTVSPAWTFVIDDEAEDVTDYVGFFQVNTKTYQSDLMFGSANFVTKDETRTIIMQHSQALLYFNVMVKDEVPSGLKFDLLFLNMDDALYTDLSAGNDYKTHLSDAADFGKYLPLKTMGNFIVDNSKNNVEAYWDLSYWADLDSAHFDDVKASDPALLWGESSGDLDANGKNKENSPYQINGVDVELDGASYVGLTQNGSLDSADEFPGADKLYQVAEQLIPEQLAVNPWLWYSFKDKDGNENYYLAEVNLPKDYWKRGHAYIYNLILDFTGPKFLIEVEPYVAKIGEAEF